MNSQLSDGAVKRRTLVKGTAWAVPAVTAASVSPVFAVSCSPEVLDSIDAVFSDRLKKSATK